MVPRLSWVTWGMPAGPETLAGMAYGLLPGPEQRGNELGNFHFFSKNLFIFKISLVSLISLYWVIVNKTPLFPRPEAIRCLPGGRRASQRAFPGPQASPKCPRTAGE